MNKKYRGFASGASSFFNPFNDQENLGSQDPQDESGTSLEYSLFPPNDAFGRHFETAYCDSQASTELHGNPGFYKRPKIPHLKSENPPPGKNDSGRNRNRLVTDKQGNPSTPMQRLSHQQYTISATEHIPLNTISDNTEETTSDSSSEVTTNLNYVFAAARVLAKVEVPAATAASRQAHNHDSRDVRNASFLRLFVDDYSDTDFKSLLHSINSNHVVEKITVFRKRRGDGERVRTREAMDCLFHVFRNISVTLKDLRLWNFLPEDLPSLSQGLADHPSIDYLQLHMESGSLDKAAATVLASMPKLVSLELEVNASFPVASLLTSGSLAVLAVIGDNFVFDSRDVIAAAEQLEVNSVLQVLDLEPRIPSWCVSSILGSVSSSTANSSLETFQFSCRASTTDEGDACVGEILKALSNDDSRLRVVWNHSYESFEVSKGVQTKTLNVLKASNVVEQFHVFVESREFCIAKCEVLERKLDSGPLS